MLNRYIAKNIKLWQYIGKKGDELDANEAAVTAAGEKYLETLMKGEVLMIEATFHMLENLVEHGEQIVISFRKKRASNLIEI